MTVGDAIKDLNKTHCHQAGFHVAMIPMEELPEEMQTVELPAHLMRQTYDWRFNKPDKEQYTVTLTAKEMEFLGHAIEVYDRVLFDLHTKPKLDTALAKWAKEEKK